ncbi:microtubule-associated protein 10 [Myripristis murdjan]|uniref:Microtubule associated protein 10 n=1 Tax=Myripristis murdjan TaxID=586833 RepID=A0A668AVJ9_9TELE|nr:microtubule-associated protein 10 [Myripristis murdjan]
MSRQTSSDKCETLFSFELLVEYIRIDDERKVSDELALGVRLLDFPTLLIYQPANAAGNGGEYTFNRGKSCLFKMDLDSLHTHLSNAPLYAMVLDVKEEIPKLVGSAQISLTKLVDRIKSEVNCHGISTPSAQEGKGLVRLCNLMGEKIGSISLTYNLSSLGASLLPHISGNSKHAKSGVHREQHIEENTTKVDPEQVPSPRLDNKAVFCKSACMTGASNDKSLIKNEARQDDGVCATTQTQTPPGEVHQSIEENDCDPEEDLTAFCPPRLFYRGSVEKTRKNETVDNKLLKLDLKSLMLDGASSEDGMLEDTNEGPVSPEIDPTVRDDVKSRNQEHHEASRVSPNVLGEALRQLPLLNALLIELSQLNGQSPQQPLSVHPNLAWIYRASTEPADEQVNPHPEGQAKLMHNTRQVASPRLKDLHSPKYCSTPRGRPASERQGRNTKMEAAFLGSKSSIAPSRKKLVHGMTKTFHLRMKLITPGLVKRHECMETRTEPQRHNAKEKTLNTTNKIIKRTSREATLNQSASLNENIETVMSSIAGHCAQQAATVRHKNKSTNKSAGAVHCRQDSDSQKLTGKQYSEAGLQWSHIPSVDGEDVSQSTDKKKHSSESCQIRLETPRSSGLSSPKSSCSDSSRAGKEEREYTDDFTSLEPSDGCSPDPLSSPEPAAAKAQRSPVCGDPFDSDSDLEDIQKRAVLPVPVKAHGSPQRSLRATHIIRPRTQASALSVSSDNDDLDGSASIQTVRSRKQTTESFRAVRGSGTESLRSSGSQRSDSTYNSSPVREYSAKSGLSCEPQEAGEMDDELGSLDFKNRYHHISELVANKLPGYTM